MERDKFWGSIMWIVIMAIGIGYISGQNAGEYFLAGGVIALIIA